MPHRVLVVDDEPAIREMLEEYFRGRGLHVDAAVDGESACDQLERDPPDLVLADLRLPGVDGLAVVRMATRRRVPSLVMTGFGTVEGVVQAYAAGASACVLKPFRLRDLYAAVDRALSRAARDRALGWAESALLLLADADAAGTAEAAEALVPRLVETLRRCPGVAYVDVVGAAEGGGPPLDATRRVEVAPCPPEARAVIAGVRAALVRGGTA